MARVSLIPAAAQDLIRLDEFLRERNTDAANRVSELLADGLRKLARYPRLGPALANMPATRQLFLGFGAGGYVIRYRLVDDEVVVIRVKHAKESQ